MLRLTTPFALAIGIVSFTLGCQKTPLVSLQNKVVREIVFEGRNVAIITTDDIYIRANVRNVSVSPIVDDRVDGTFVDGRVRDNGYGLYSASENGELVTLAVRNVEQLNAWKTALETLEKKYYAPRDVLPPPVS